MTSFTVKQAFATPTRRFSPGQTIDPSDVDGPLTFADWIKLGYITSPPPAPKAAKEAPAAE